MNNQSKYKPGDWVRFWRDGQFQLGVVQYVKTFDDKGIFLLTDVGLIPGSDVLEARPAPTFILEPLKKSPERPEPFRTEPPDLDDELTAEEWKRVALSLSDKLFWATNGRVVNGVVHLNEGESADEFIKDAIKSIIDQAKKCAGVNK